MLTRVVMTLQIYIMQTYTNIRPLSCMSEINVNYTSKIKLRWKLTSNRKLDVYNKMQEVNILTT